MVRYMIDKTRIDLEFKEGRVCLSYYENITKWRPPLVVSLTSWPRRIGEAHYAIYSLFHQTMLPDRIVLWLSPEEFPRREAELPDAILLLKKQGLTIEWRENYRQYNKLVHALHDYGECLIVTVDDDIYYPAGMLEMLYQEHVRHPRDIIAHRVHEIGLGEDGSILPYSRWKKEIPSRDPRLDVLPTGVGGVLYPGRGALHPDVCNPELFNTLAHDNDDLWFWAMAARQGTPIRTPQEPLNRLEFVNPEKEKRGIDTLAARNVMHRGNDDQMRNLLAYYPDLLALLNREQGKTCQNQIPHQETSSLPMLIFPFHLFPSGSRVAIVGERELVLALQREAEGQDYLSVTGSLPLEGNAFARSDLQVLCRRDFDFLLLAYLNRDKAVECRTCLVSLGVRAEKIKWDGESYMKEGFYQRVYTKWLRVMQGQFRSEKQSGKGVAAAPGHTVKECTAPRILVDTTMTSDVRHTTGIRRVVRKVYASLKSLGQTESLAICCRNREMFISHRFEPTQNRKRVDFSHGDRLLLIDSSWDCYQEEKWMLDQAVERNLQSYVFIYDLIAVRHTEWFAFPPDHFEKHMRLVFLQANHLICISKAVADDVSNYYREQGIKRKSPLFLHWIHLGFDLEKSKGESIRSRLQEFFFHRRVVVMVGTVQIRKDQGNVIRAFAKLLEETGDQNIGLLIVGQSGWLNDEFKQLYQKHQGANILWLRDLSDAELQWAYRHAEALLLASLAEGYGLPLVEAAYFGLPILCSDIPIFREVTQGYATFFQPGNVDAIRKALELWREGKIDKEASKRIRLYTWEECAREVLDIISGTGKPYAILQ